MVMLERAVFVLQGMACYAFYQGDLLQKVDPEENHHMIKDTTKILLVEDEPMIAQLYAAVLQSRYDVVTAHSKQAAVARLLEQRPDVLLLDLMIPIGAGEDRISYDHPVGFDILEWMRHHKELQKTKVVIVTNLESDEHRRHAEQLGVVMYLVKAAMEPYELVRHVDALTGRPV